MPASRPQRGRLSLIVHPAGRPEGVGAICSPQAEEEMYMDSRILRNLSYGMYAIGVKGENAPSACIVNTVIQVTSANPTIIAVSMNHNNYSHECIVKHGIFTVSVLSEDTPGTVIGALGFNSGRDVNKLLNIRHRVLMEGVPVIKENTCCWFLCKVVGSIETSTHTVIIAGSEKSTGVPMTYSYYHTVIKGSSPKNAPTYQPLEAASGSDGETYVCTICKYEYSDPDTSFEELPDDWVCPICGAPKSAFVRK